MSRTVGSINLRAGLDSKALLAEATVAGEEAGALMGDGMDSTLTKRFDASVKRLGPRFEKAGADLGKRFEKTFGPRLSKILNKLTVDMNKFSKAIQNNRVQVENHGASLKRWQAITIAIIALITGAGREIAALGSALGAGITVLLQGVGALAVAAAVGFVAFKGLTGKVEDLPEPVRESAQAFQDLGKQLKAVGQQLTVAAFKNSTKTWQLLSKVIDGLTPHLEKVAEAVGRVTDRLVKGLAPGTKAYKDLASFIDLSVPIFEKAASVAGKFGKALLAALGSPRLAKSTSKLLDWLGKLGDGLIKFFESDKFAEWLDNADSVFGAIGRLLDSLGRTLNRLSTIDAVKSLNNLLDATSRLLPVLGGLIEVGGKLDPLGLIATAFDAIGKAIEPILVPLGNVADALHRVADIMIKEWGDKLGPIADSLAGPLQSVADALNDMDEDTIKNIADALLALAAAFVVVKGAKGIAGLATKLTDLASGIDALSGKSAAMKGIAAGLVSALAVSITDAGSDDKTKNPFESLITTWITGAATGLVVAGPIGGAVGLIIGLIQTALFQQDNITRANKMWEDWFNTTLAIPFSVNVTVPIQNFFTSVLTNLAIGFLSVQTSFTAWFAGVESNWNSFWNGLPVTIVTVGATIIGNVTNFMSSIQITLAIWFAGVQSNWNNFWNGLLANVIIWWNGIVAAVVQWAAKMWVGLKGNLDLAKRNWDSFWSGLGDNIDSTFSMIYSTVSYWVNQIIDAVNGALNMISKLTGGVVNLKVPKLPATATGGVFYTAQTRLIGEAGPEAVVPLDRPLSQVDPAVRALSAYAQGKAEPQVTTGGGASVVFMPGSIVSPYSDPALVAEQAADRVAEKLAV